MNEIIIRGGKPLEGFASYTHEVPLESLQDVFSGEEVAELCRVAGLREVTVSKDMFGRDRFVSALAQGNAF